MFNREYVMRTTPGKMPAADIELRNSLTPLRFRKEFAMAPRMAADYWSAGSDIARRTIACS